MTSDLQALLAEIVADPADDTARLVYADCLQENGNAPRAEFIRLQVEAERLHRDSNERAELERSATRHAQELERIEREAAHLRPEPGAPAIDFTPGPEKP